VLDAPEESRDLHLLDLNMLVLFGARERTIADYGDLLDVAGFDRGTMFGTDTAWNIIEARPV
jgi:hypothetical protein